MGRVVGRLLALAMVTVVGHIALCAAYGGPNQYAPNYGVELSELEQQMPLKDGLAWGYYLKSCPNAETIINTRFEHYFLISGFKVAPGLIRLLQHDCFVQGCDASILLRSSSGSGELDDIGNQNIRTIALELIEDVKAKLEAECPRIVSCADIVVWTAARAVHRLTPPGTFNVPLGRRDSLTFGSTRDLPVTNMTFKQLSSNFGAKGLNTEDLVALSGAHTVGSAHCPSFQNRLYPTVDPRMNPAFAASLKSICPDTTVPLDRWSPWGFDYVYYYNLVTGWALLETDQNLDQDTSAWGLVNFWSNVLNQQHWFNQFVLSFVKMSQIDVLTGNEGEIRKVCSTTNSGKVTDSSIEMPVIECEAVPETVEPVQTTSSRESELISMVV